jgi:hypothetical protein
MAPMVAGDAFATRGGSAAQGGVLDDEDYVACDRR